MFFSQTSSHGFYHLLFVRAGLTPIPPRFPSAAIEQSQLCSDDPDNFVMVGAKQDLTYASDASVHPNNIGYEQHGQKFAQVFERVCLNQQRWTPLQLKSAQMQSPFTMIATFDVPKPPLSWDASIVDPGARGFSLASGTAINSATIISPTQVELTLATAYTAGVDRLQYAWDNFNESGDYNGLNYPRRAMGKEYGSRGQLQDSDSLAGSNYNQANHCIHCSVSVFGLNTLPIESVAARSASLAGSIRVRKDNAA